MITELSREYWIDTLIDWAEDRLPGPQLDECRAALDFGALLIARAEAAEAALEQTKNDPAGMWLAGKARGHAEAAEEAARLRAALAVALNENAQMRRMVLAVGRICDGLEETFSSARGLTQDALSLAMYRIRADLRSTAPEPAAESETQG